MIVNEISFHDCQILKVKENSKKQSLDFILNFPTDWKNNYFEKKILRFENVTFYSLEEIPFGNLPTILEIINLGQTSNDLSTERSNFIVIRQKIKIITNAGIRVIEFSNCRFVDK